jgi:threonine dehydratase
MSRALEAGEPVVIDPITTKVQGLCPMATGALNLRIVQRHVAGVLTLEDERIFAAQRTLVRAGHRVEAAGAATFAALGAGAPPPEMLEGRGPANPLRVACVVSGGNCEPEELARLS